MSLVRPRLPAELVDIVIDFLHDDHHALKSCALVCRSWLLSSRYHLFHTYRITDRLKAQSCIIFFKITPDVAAYIRRLEIKRGFDHSIEFTALVDILQALPSIRAIELSEVSLGKPQPRQNTHELELPSKPVFGPLEELTVHTCNITTYDFALLFRLLGLFAEIRHVDLSQRSTARVPLSQMARRAQAAVPSHHISIVHLQLFNIPLPVVTNLVCRTRTAECLHTLDIDDNMLDWPDADKLGAIFAHIGPSRSLRRVVLGTFNHLVYTSPRGQENEGSGHLAGWSALQLSRCESLEDFNLCTTAVVKKHADLVATLPATIKTVTITFIWWGRPEAPCDWAPLDQILSAERFHDSKLVLKPTESKNPLYPEVWAQFASSAREALSRITSQGKLVIASDSGRGD